MKFVLALVFCGLTARDARAESSPVSDLVRQLGDVSNHKRAAAAEQLRTSAVEGVRAALLDASHHEPDPEIRQRAARLLCDMSWAIPSDPAPVRITLGNYRTPLTEKRIEALSPLVALGAPAIPALIRLLNEEPSDDVRWDLVVFLRSMEDADVKLREIKPAMDDAPMLAAAGWGWEASDPEKAAPLFRRAVQLAATQPADDHGEVDTLLLKLFARAINRAEYADAVDLYRQHLWFTDAPADMEAQDLFALYAQYGPQPGFERDVRTFESFFTQPQMMYVMGKLYAGRGERLAAQACYAAAGAASIGSPEERSRIGLFLMAHQWFDLARAEFQKALDAPAENRAVQDGMTYFNLARCAEGMGDELQAAKDLDAAEKAIEPLPNAAVMAHTYAAMADWHRLRDAADKKDRPRMATLATKLLNNAAWRSEEVATVDIDIDLVRALKTLDRRDEAGKVFDQAYRLLRITVDNAPHDPETLNNIAWLCARAGEHTDEAYRWAAEAIRLAPGNAAYLDTAAEASAAAGKLDEAIARESAALTLQPGERFMRAQLEHFKALKKP